LHAHRCKHGLMTCPVHVRVQFVYRLVNLAPEPTRARTARVQRSAQVASEAARRGNQQDAEPESDGASSSESEEEEAAPPPPRAVPTASGKKQKAAPPQGQAKRAKHPLGLDRLASTGTSPTGSDSLGPSGPPVLRPCYRLRRRLSRIVQLSAHHRIDPATQTTFFWIVQY
jgi:hypothetical protein